MFAFVAPFLLMTNVTSIRSQQLTRPKSSESSVTNDVENVSLAVSEKARAEKKPETTEEKLNALELLLERQGQQLDQLQRTVAEQQELIRLLAGKLSTAPAATTPSATPAANPTGRQIVAEY